MPTDVQEQVFSIQFLMSQMGWGLIRIDHELRSGNIAIVRKGGRTHFQFLKDMGQSYAYRDMIHRQRQRAESRDKVIGRRYSTLN